ncbi:MAG: DMT family transporter [Pseudomonadota bacterium]|nr:DMT family transporter [Pseudomonadota bacterium]
MKIDHTILAISVMGVWASNIVAVRIGTEEITDWTLVTLRMTLMTVILSPFVPYPHGHIKKIIGLSVTMGTLHFGLMFAALERIHAGTAAQIFITSVPFALLLALICFRERLSWRQARGVLVSFLASCFCLVSRE